MAKPHGMWDLSSLTRDQTCTPCIGRVGSYLRGLPGQSFTWILDQELSKILSPSFPMDKDHSQYHRCLKPGWIISPNLLIPQMRKPRPCDLFWLLTLRFLPGGCPLEVHRSMCPDQAHTFTCLSREPRTETPGWEWKQDL